MNLASARVSRHTRIPGFHCALNFWALLRIATKGERRALVGLKGAVWISLCAAKLVRQMTARLLRSRRPRILRETCSAKNQKNRDFHRFVVTLCGTTSASWLEIGDVPARRSRRSRLIESASILRGSRIIHPAETGPQGGLQIKSATILVTSISETICPNR
jgi:hypothetical protein